MATVFLSYSTRDHFFAELAHIKLVEAGIDLWRDQGRLRAGTDWRGGIEQGIVASIAVVVALSSHSSESSYVTFEWAYGLGKGKPVIPVKLTECAIHPRLETIQYLDFSVPGALPWVSLVERIQEIEAEATPEEDKPEGILISVPELATASSPTAVPGNTAETILDFLNQRGYQMASFEGLRKRIDGALTDENFKEVIDQNPAVFRSATLKGAKPGLAKLIP